ncbi:MAG: DUF1788 domain-containing protein [Methanobrevibacter sp.]|uniref:DUF1788 domain-containing protein n=1 Tax=Methanobrevibacter sp. TaxID=66852 RepID=UPI0026E01B28|nr:DUF1788 domain-containing protein [Methanobrevibacter sp.]MDO5849539.1 DUF1788 domain-containing protein [Methanobrevibacter sp.]
MVLDERFEEVYDKIKKESFLENKGLGNEVGYYVFDYDPEDELKVRKKVDEIVNRINSKDDLSFKIINFDLYDIIIGILKEKNFLEKTFKFEEKKGKEFVKRAVVKSLKLSQDSNLIVNYILENTPEENAIVFLTGVGKAYPLLRSHQVLNNLHQVLDQVPVILFFPGTYSGNDLRLFNTLESNNYYRAFKLVE